MSLIIEEYIGSKGFFFPETRRTFSSLKLEGNLILENESWRMLETWDSSKRKGSRKQGGNKVMGTSSSVIHSV